MSTTPSAGPWLILGAGSLGRLLACRLASHVELALLGRQASREPLLLTDPEGVQSALGIARLRIDQAPPTPAMVHITTKSHAVEPALRELMPHIAPDTPLVLWQNGYQVQQPLTRRWPGPVLCATTSEGAYVDGADGVVHAGHGHTFIGHLDGEHSALASQVASVLDSTGLASEACTDIHRRLWHKLVVNAAINPLAARHRIANGRLREPAFRPRIEAIVAESATIMDAEGIAPPESGWAAMVWRVIESTAGNRASMLQDVLAGRPTEREAILAPLLEAATRHGLDVPVLQRLYRDTPD
ncbi:ketopantoate reductase family protein [Halomonas sp. HP20-15]|uniref:ketopantoate reductase family protein n=1 Tax=Halomonas sp. HP20-15 TaxID=3085901 RepID=UPI002981E978|nr:ketopantoate reductase family protein [Halomonas sp. HP20-15]MDW5375729.1 ketopantoate reductase family protein [Halomonas sp. HP20-15]